jgi:uncharacterized protein (DUF1330 family)
MPAYLIADIEVQDPQQYERYKLDAAETIARFGGRYLARGGTTEMLEGKWNPKRLVILEFPSMARLREWYASPAYQPLIALRQRTTSSSLVITEGLPPER